MCFPAASLRVLASTDHCTTGPGGAHICGTTGTKHRSFQRPQAARLARPAAYTPMGRYGSRGMTTCLPAKAGCGCSAAGPPPPHPPPSPTGIYNAVSRSDSGTGHRLGIQNAPAGGPSQITDHMRFWPVASSDSVEGSTYAERRDWSSPQLTPPIHCIEKENSTADGAPRRAVV